MTPRDFDVDRLAAYLHLAPQQIVKMVEREQLPGRRVGGEWRFSPEEIHHWLEERIGASNESQLIEVEDVLSRAAACDEPPLALHELLPPEAIALPLNARTSGSVIQSMVALAAATGLLWDPDKMEEAVRARENLHPTALDNGVALLHPRRPMSNILAEPLIAFGRTAGGIPFGGSRGVLTDLFFLICSTHDGEHLRILARLSRLLGDDVFLGDLREAASPAEVVDLFRDAEAALDD